MTDAIVQPVADSWPVTSFQAGLLMQAHREHRAGIDHVQKLYQIHGELDGAAFEAAWQATVARHSVLRSRFHSDGDRELQVVAPATALSTPPVHRIDWRALPPEVRREQLRDVQRFDRNRPFDLDRAPLCRLTLARIGERAHWLLLSFPHVLLDGRSAQLVLEDVIAGCRAARGGRPAELGPAPRFGDYADWLAARDVAGAVDFWRPVLAGASTPTSLGIQRIIGVADPRAGTVDRMTVTMTGAEWQAVRDGARRRRLTVPSLLHGAWAVLLSRYGRTDDVLFGSTAMQRPPGVRGSAGMVGLLLSTVPVRLRVPPDAEPTEWLRAVQPILAQARRYGHLPLFELQSLTEVPGRTPLFRSILNVVVASNDIDAGGLSVRHLDTTARTGYPLVVNAIVGSELLDLCLEYEPEQFARAAVAGLAEALARVVRELATGPAKRLRDIELLGEAAGREQLRIGAPMVPVRPGRLLPATILDHPRSRPDALAVIRGDVTLTYGELVAEAGRLARGLLAAGVTAGDVVATMVADPVSSVVAAVAVLFAGGGWLPLDPACSEARLRQAATDSGCTVVVADKDQGHRLSGLPLRLVPPTAPDVDLDQGPDLPGVADGDLAVVVAGAGAAAATGMSHGALAAACRAIAETTGIGPDDRIMLTGSAGVDVPADRLAAVLAAGATLVLCSAELWPPSDFPSLARRFGLTVAELAPGYWTHLVRTLEQRAETGLGPLRLVVVGGERVARDWAARWSSVSGGVRLANGYWSDDVLISTAMWNHTDDRATLGAPAGRPLPHLRVELLDPDLRPVPSGAPGELHVVLDGLMTIGNRTPDAVGDRHPTGDLARWSSDGCLELLGRVHQGNQIQPADLSMVEATLRSHDGVEDAVALSGDDPRIGGRLVAHVLAKAGSTIDPEALRSFVADRLPRDLVPAAILPVPGIPLTAAGRIDLAELRGPADAPDADEEAVSPTEMRLLTIWREVLGHSEFGRHQDFFEVGGNSSSMMKVAARVRATISGKVPLRVLFKNPTIAGIAEVLDREFVTAQRAES